MLPFYRIVGVILASRQHRYRHYRGGDGLGVQDGRAADRTRTRHREFRQFKTHLEVLQLNDMTCKHDSLSREHTALSTCLHKSGMSQVARVLLAPCGD